MDPNANLESQNELLRKIAQLNPCTEKRRLQRELKVLRAVLLEWLGKGGFEPEWDHYPATIKYFGCVTAPNRNGALRPSYKVAKEAGCAR